MISPLARAFVLVSTFMAAATAAAEERPQKPNIVLIFIDDMGYGDIGPFGNTKVKTPHLDRLAAEGMKFTSFYATPVCSMSRASLMTGCYNTRVSIPGVLFPGSQIGLHPDEITLAKIVKPKGYATTCIGKWHLGHREPFLPTKQGFDSYFGIPYSNDMTIDPKHARFAKGLRVPRGDDRGEGPRRRRPQQGPADAWRGDRGVPGRPGYANEALHGGGGQVHRRQPTQTVLPLPAAHDGAPAAGRLRRFSRQERMPACSATPSRKSTGRSAGSCNRCGNCSSIEKPW